MADNILINVPDSVLSRCQCYVCRGYLSCSPIRVLPDGNCICGRCSYVNDQSQIYRVFALEAILCRTLFPCKFQQYGCTERVLFDKVFEHESNCTHRFFACPLFSQKMCTWEGTTAQMLKHFTDVHSNFTRQDIQLKLKVDEDANGILLVVQDNIGILVKYEYDSNRGDLNFNIRYCTHEPALDVNYKLQLINDSNNECSVSLKTNKCFRFDDNFYDMQNATTLNVKPFLHCLDKPTHVIIAIITQVRATNNCNVTLDNAGIVNYNVLNSLRCHKCSEYLVIPIFNLAEHIVCSDCARNDSTCVPSSDNQLENLIAQANYPCRWRNCTFIGKSSNIKQHESLCQFRYYNCLFKNCSVMFKLNSAISHLQCHKAKYSPNQIKYRIEFSHSHTFKHIFTIIDGTIVSVQYSMVELLRENVFRISLHSSGSSSIEGNLEIEHQHCKLKSKAFLLEMNREIDISMEKLPRCFKINEELTVTINVST